MCAGHDHVDLRVDAGVDQQLGQVLAGGGLGPRIGHGPEDAQPRHEAAVAIAPPPRNDSTHCRTGTSGNT